MDVGKSFQLAHFKDITRIFILKKQFQKTIDFAWKFVMEVACEKGAWVHFNCARYTAIHSWSAEGISPCLMFFTEISKARLQWKWQSFVRDRHMFWFKHNHIDSRCIRRIIPSLFVSGFQLCSDLYFEIIFNHLVVPPGFFSFPNKACFLNIGFLLSY